MKRRRSLPKRRKKKRKRVEEEDVVEEDRVRKRQKIVSKPKVVRQKKISKQSRKGKGTKEDEVEGELSWTEKKKDVQNVIKPISPPQQQQQQQPKRRNQIKMKEPDKMEIDGDDDEEEEEEQVVEEQQEQIVHEDEDGDVNMSSTRTPSKEMIQPKIVIAKKVVTPGSSKKMKGFFKKSRGRSRKIKKMRDMSREMRKNPLSFTLPDDGVFRKQFSQFRKATSIPRKYTIKNVIGLIVGRDTLEDMNKRRDLAQKPRFQSSANSKPRIYYDFLVIDISKAVEDVRRMKRDSVIVFDDSNGTKCIQLPFMKITQSSNNVIKHVPEGNSPMIIKEGDILRVSMYETDAHVQESTFVALHDLYYSLNTKSRNQSFSLKARAVEDLITSSCCDESFITYLARKLTNLSRTMNSVRMDPLPEPTIGEDGNKVFVPTPNYIIPSSSAYELFYENMEEDPPTHIYCPTFTKCIAEKTKDKMLTMEIDVAEAEDSSLDSWRRILMSAAAFGRSNKTKKLLPTLDLFGVQKKENFDILMRNVSNDEESELDIVPPFVMYAGIYRGKNRGSSDVLNEGATRFQKCEDPFDIEEWGYKTNVIIKGIVPSIAHFLKVQGFGIPTSPESAMIAILKTHKNQGFQGLNLDMTINYAKQELEKINSGNPFNITYTGERPNYLQQADTGFNKRKKDDIYNLSEYNGDISGFFKDVKNGNADFYLWMANESMSTEQTVIWVNKNDEVVENPKVENVDEKKLVELILGRSGRGTMVPKTGWVTQLFVIYNKDE